MDVLLAIVRMMHYAGTISLFGIATFQVLVSTPALRTIHRDVTPQANVFLRQLSCATCLSLGVWFASLLVWLAIEAVNMSGLTFSESVRHGIFVTVLTQTQFGHSCELRLICGALLMGCLYSRQLRTQKLTWASDISLLILTATMLVSVAWIGHAGAMRSGRHGTIHLMTDGAHLLAVGAWLGGLLPLALFYHHNVGRDRLAAIQMATSRFSVLGLICVATIIVTGTVNAWFMVGNISLLTGSAYGRLLLIKICLFLGMAGIATVNRVIITPQLFAGYPGSSQNDAGLAIRRLQRNTLVEAVLGMGVLFIVGMLGIAAPGHPVLH